MWKAKAFGLTFGSLAMLYVYDNNVFSSIHSLRRQPYSDFLISTPESKENINEKVKTLGLPVLKSNFFFTPSKENIKLTKCSTGIHFVRKIGDKTYTNPLEQNHKLEKWVKFHKDLYDVVNTKDQLIRLMKSRKKNEFLDSLVLAYVPDGDEDRENKLRELVATINFEDPMSSILSSYAARYVRVVKVTDENLARELGIDSKDNMEFLRVKDSRGWFHSIIPRSLYVPSDVFRKYIDTHLASDYKINGHEMQYDLKIYFDKLIYGTLNNPQTYNFSDLKDLASVLCEIDPLIIPIFSIKQLQLVSAKVFFKLQSENSKLLLISIKKDHQEEDLNDLQSIMQGLKIEEFARKHPEILIIVGLPEFIYHLPIKDIALYHYEDIEVRLIDINKGAAVNSVYLQENMQLDELLEVKEKRLESSPPSAQQHAEILSKEEFYEQILKNKDRCCFVMNCSKTCPACSYQDNFFQKAAEKSDKCKFLKYYVSNQSPHFKGPNATPRYHLYVPGSIEPVVYEPKVHGIQPENFLQFVEAQLAGTRNIS